MQRAGTTAPRAISRRRRALAPIVLALITATAACSGGDGEADITTTPSSTPPPTSVVATTTEPTTTTTVATPPTDPTTTTTVPPTTTQPPLTTGATTTDAVGTVPTSTTAADLAAAIEAGWREATGRYIEALQNPGDETLGRAAIEYRSGDSLFAALERIAGLVESQQRLLPEPVVPATLTLEGGPVPIDDGSGDYLLTVCEIDSWVLVQDTADGETVISDQVIADRSEIRMKLIDDRWTINKRTVIEFWEAAACEPG